MPLSSSDHISTVLHYIQALAPQRILDVGVGSGAYGFLLRQYLDIAAERVQPEQWQTHIDGVELFQAYRNPVWDFAYDSILFGDIRTIIDTLGNYDCILFNDVLEHVERDEARTLVKKGLAKSKVVIATTPNWEMPQGAWGGNEAETHRCYLDRSDFPGLVIQEFAGTTDCFLCSTDPASVAALRRAARSSLVGNPLRIAFQKARRKLRG